MATEKIEKAELLEHEKVLLQAESELRRAHSANVARKSGTVFGYDTYANLPGVQVAALLRELDELRAISRDA